MAEGMASPPAFFTFATADMNDPLYRFDATEWIDPPAIPLSDDPDYYQEKTYRRAANGSLYGQCALKSEWQRYVTLGYFAIDDGSVFEYEWSNLETKPLRVHRMIWYHYMF